MRGRKPSRSAIISCGLRESRLLFRARAHQYGQAGTGGATRRGWPGLRHRGTAGDSSGTGRWHPGSCGHAGLARLERGTKEG